MNYVKILILAILLVGLVSSLSSDSGYHLHLDQEADIECNECEGVYIRPNTENNKWTLSPIYSETNSLETPAIVSKEFKNNVSVVRSHTFGFGHLDENSNHIEIKIGHNSEGLLLAASVFDDDIRYSRLPVTNWNGFDGMQYDFLIDGKVHTAQTMIRWFENDQAYARFGTYTDGEFIEVNTNLNHQAAWFGDGLNNLEGDRGWFSIVTIPWDVLGGIPQNFNLTVTNYDLDSDYQNFQTWSGRVTLDQTPLGSSGTIQQVYSKTTGLNIESTHVGGSFDCGVAEKPLFFPTWGDVSYYPTTQLNIQSQMNTEDWPCFSKVLIWFDIPEEVNRDKVSQVVLKMGMFGHAGYAWPHNGDEFIPPSNIQAIWSEVPTEPYTWNNSPEIIRHLSTTYVQTEPIEFINPPKTYGFDITASVKYNSKDQAAIILYSSDWDIHSGKYFWSDPEVIINYE